MDETRIIHGNALDLPLEDATVDLAITSPPYWGLRSYRDDGCHYEGQVGSEATPQEFLRALWRASDELYRVLKPTGSAFINLGEKYAGSGGHNNGAYGVSGLHKDRPSSGTRDAGRDAIASLRNAPDRYNLGTQWAPAKSLMGLPWAYALGMFNPELYRDAIDPPPPGGHPRWLLRAEICWSKPNGLPESVTDRVRRSHEVFFHFTKQGRYFSAVDEVREAQASLDRPTGRSNGQDHRRADLRRDHSDETQMDWLSTWQPNPLGKLPGSVWTIPSEPLVIPDAVRRHYNLPDHFAAFPQEWPRRIILGWSPNGVCVECGEGRRPVSIAEHERPTGGWKPVRDAADGANRPVGLARPTSQIRITGYACACPEPTADTTPAVILDPFCGTGTVPLVARALGRIGIGVDLSKDYCRLAEWRVFHSGAGDKAERRTWAERQLGLL